MCSIYGLIFITNLYCNYCTFVHRYVDGAANLKKEKEKHFSSDRWSLVIVNA